MKRVGASAPGKALLCGEYAVLEGAPAVVAAVDRRVTARWTDDVQRMPPEVEATLARAYARSKVVPGSLELDASALQHDHVKLGLGSSAAAAVAAAGAVFATHGDDLRDPRVTARVFECALEGHRAVAPEGSGVDVAASTFGGFLHFNCGGSSVDARPLDVPSDLSIRLVWTGHAARTSELLARVHQLRRDAPDTYRTHMERLSGLASGFAEAFDAGRAIDVVGAAAQYAGAMGALGDASGAPIVEARLGLAIELASRFSGSAKPCGAGGGDVAVAFFVNPAAADAFKLACRDEGLHPIDVSWGAAGVRAD